MPALSYPKRDVSITLTKASKTRGQGHGKVSLLVGAIGDWRSRGRREVLPPTTGDLHGQGWGRGGQWCFGYSSRVVVNCKRAPIPARFGYRYNPSAMPCCVAWYGRGFRASFRGGGRTRQRKTRQHAASSCTKPQAKCHVTVLTMPCPRCNVAWTQACQHPT